MKQSILAISKGNTPGETAQKLANAIDEACRALSSFKSDNDQIDIILAHDDGSHNYAVLASIVAKPVGSAYDREIKIWQNEQALKALSIKPIPANKKAVITQILDKAFDEIGNVHNLLSFRSERDRMEGMYNWLAQMIEANFELKEDYGRI